MTLLNTMPLLSNVLKKQQKKTAAAAAVAASVLQCTTFQFLECRSAIQQACLLRCGRLRKEAIKEQSQVTRYVDPPDQTNGMFLERVTEQPDLVARHLMLSGDVESNPGPVTRSQTKAQGEERHTSGIREAGPRDTSSAEQSREADGVGSSEQSREADGVVSDTRSNRREDENGSRAVSYTHLTLPTIYSV